MIDEEETACLRNHSAFRKYVCIWEGLARGQVGGALTHLYMILSNYQAEWTTKLSLVICIMSLITQESPFCWQRLHSGWVGEPPIPAPEKPLSHINHQEKKVLPPGKAGRFVQPSSSALQLAPKWTEPPFECQSLALLLSRPGLVRLAQGFGFAAADLNLQSKKTDWLWGWRLSATLPH